MSQLNDFIAAKMHKMQDEDRPQKQKLAIAFSYARKEGLKGAKKKPSMLERIFKK